MKTDNKVIQGLWIGTKLSVMEQLSIKSFLDNGHEYHLYTYRDIDNVPVGAVIKDGSSILPENRIFTYQSGWGKGSYAGFADLFRYHLLDIKGGWWVDTDIICLKPFDFNSDCVIASSYEGKWGEPANNCVLKLSQGSQLSRFLINATEALNFERVEFGETGPLLLQEAVKKLDLHNYVISSQVFCPITWRAVGKKIVYPLENKKTKSNVIKIKDALRPLIRPESRTGKITKESYAVHLWNEIWRQNDLDKNTVYDKRCLYEHLKRKYLFFDNKT